MKSTFSVAGRKEKQARIFRKTYKKGKGEVSLALPEP